MPSAPKNPVIASKYSEHKCWYVLYVKSRSEKKVSAVLQKNAIEIFLPLIKIMRQWSDRKKQIEIPLFNGYLFVYTTPEYFTFIRMAEGAVDFIKQEGKYAVIKESIIQSIKKFIETGVHMETVANYFEPGEKVKINFGPLKDCEGEIISMENEKHFIVRIDALQQVLKLFVPAQYLQKI